jgi:hypothetical protein
VSDSIAHRIKSLPTRWFGRTANTVEVGSNPQVVADEVLPPSVQHVHDSVNGGDTIEDRTTTLSGPRLYIRDDGTVDWDGALQDQAALRKFGTAVWARINGRDPDFVDNAEDDENTLFKFEAAGSDLSNALDIFHGGNKEVTAKIEDTPQIRQARRRLETLQQEYRAQDQSHNALLTSVLPRQTAGVGSVVNLASVPANLRQQIRESAETLNLLQVEVSYQTLIYELERSKLKNNFSRGNEVRNQSVLHALNFDAHYFVHSFCALNPWLAKQYTRIWRKSLATPH